MNDTILLAFIVAAAVVIALLLGWVVLAARARRFPYRLAGPLLSNAERAFHGALVQAAGDRHLVFVKVRVADVLTPRSDLGRSDWWRAFASISSKHFDFVICDPQDCAVRLAVELDDASHREAERQQRDTFLNGACEAAGLPLLRVAATRSYAVAELRRRIGEVALTAPVATAAPASSRAARAAAAQPQQQQHASLTPPPPACPKCGAPMVLRHARSSGHAGQAFWGCSAFPRCRGSVDMEVRS